MGDTLEKKLKVKKWQVGRQFAEERFRPFSGPIQTQANMWTG